MDTNEMLREINEASREIPFENSIFQTDNFIVKGQYTPARAYRAILLRLNNRIQALNEAKYGLAKEDIDIEELRFKIDVEKAKDDPNTFDVRRWELDIKQKLERRDYTMKLAEDAVVEVNHLYGLFKKFPRYTRKQFEAEEYKHFSVSLNRQMQGIAGAPDSLEIMGGLQGLKDAMKVDPALLEIVSAELPLVQGITLDKELPQIAG